jgi:hypothetical protein
LWIEVSFRGLGLVEVFGLVDVARLAMGADVNRTQSCCGFTGFEKRKQRAGVQGKEILQIFGKKRIGKIRSEVEGGRMRRGNGRRGGLKALVYRGLEDFWRGARSGGFVGIAGTGCPRDELGLQVPATLCFGLMEDLNTEGRNAGTGLDEAGWAWV